MKRFLIAAALIASQTFAIGREPERNPSFDDPEDRPRPVVTPPPAPYPNDLPRAGYPVPEPPLPKANGLLPHRLPWTLNGSRFLIAYVRDVCQGDTYIRCENVAKTPATGSGDWGFRIYRKDTGAYLGTVDRNVGEEIQADYDRSIAVAEEHRPESAWIARKEAEKAQLEYIAAACTSGAVYCTGMAAKMQKFKELFTAACSLWSGVCVTKITEMKVEIQQKIDNVKKACADNDQACFDAVTNGGETQARWQRSEEKKGGATGGSTSTRPPHDVRPVFLNGEGDPMRWYDDSCKNCKIIEGKEAEDY